MNPVKKLFDEMIFGGSKAEQELANDASGYGYPVGYTGPCINSTGYVAPPQNPYQSMSWKTATQMDIVNDICKPIKERLPQFDYYINPFDDSLIIGMFGEKKVIANYKLMSESTIADEVAEWLFDMEHNNHATKVHNHLRGLYEKKEK